MESPCTIALNLELQGSFDPSHYIYKFKLFLKACRSLSTSFTCVVTANVYA